MIDLLVLGVITGFVSGFFGVGGGMILVPMLLYSGFVMKEAVAISVMQMVFSSIYGSYLNSKTNKSLIKDGIAIGLGGFCGGLLSGFIVTSVTNEFLEYLFLIILCFAVYRLLMVQPAGKADRKEQNKIILFIVGFFIGMIAMSIGVGGSVMLTPILSSYMHYPLKDATSIGLFFVIFSSVAGFSSLSIAGEMLFIEGAIVGISSLIGVYLGIKTKNITKITSYKTIVLVLYIGILLAMIKRMFF